MKADAQTEAEIKALVEDVWRKYARKDIDACLGLWTSDPDLVAIGTGADELRLGPEELRRGLRRDFEQAENIKITTEWLRISAAGDVAWSAANCGLRLLSAVTRHRFCAV
jgi:ketosteroid isomerase-like protein